MSLTSHEKVSVASEFVLQSPPGEINDVITDLRAVFEDEGALEKGLLPALEEYNMAQFATVDVPQPQKMVISAAGKAAAGEAGRFLDPRSSKTYAINHAVLTASDPQAHEANQDTETLRKGLEKAADSYVAAHFPHREKEGSTDANAHGNSTCAVLSPVSTSSSKVWTVQIVSNKYKPNNFWSGRWRSSYEVEPEKLEVRGRIAVDVHYYEQGNVQLHTVHTPHITLPSASVTGAQIMTLIEDEESKYQGTLSDSFQNMRDGGFRGLRRVLPVTRGKMDWDKVMGYKLGQELAGARSGSGNSFQ